MQLSRGFRCWVLSKLLVMEYVKERKVADVFHCLLHFLL